MQAPRPASGAGGGPRTGTHALGRAGEAAAAAALRSRGYRILDRNVRIRRGEVDLVADDAGTIVFVEVKARRSAAYGTPAEAVGGRKRRTLVALAEAYLARRRLGGRPCRFDVVEVWASPGGRILRVEILCNAFQS